MEKRRRARINQSLAALKTLILDSAKADNTKHSKLEKADILELTVRHFQRHRSLDTPGVHQYRAGYADCVREVQRYLETPDAHTMTVMDAGVRQRLLRHLDNCIAEVDTDLRPPSNPEERLQPPDSSTAEEVNNNGRDAAMLVHPDGTSQPTLPTKMVKTYDGNFVFVLPSHYVQLASALGINIRAQAITPGEETPCTTVKQEQVEDLPSTLAEHLETSPLPMEKPIDFSKNEMVQNNDRDSMWRPW